MKFIIIGLGNFGFALAEKLTQLGHEVIGVDKNIEKIEDVKDKVTYAICLDCSQQSSINRLPLKNTDVVVVAIGEDVGANLLTTATVKKLGIPNVISRSSSNIHEAILESMKIEGILHPEVETAERWAKKLTTPGLIDSFELIDENSIVEVEINGWFVGKTIEEVGFNKNYNVIVLTIIENTDKKHENKLFRHKSKVKTEGVAKADTVLNEGDIMILYGHNKNIQRLLKNQ